MKLNRNFLTQEIDGEALLVPCGDAGFSGIVRGNSTFGAMLELLKTETTEEELVAAMAERFDAPEDVIRRDVQKMISEMRKIGALDE